MVVSRTHIHRFARLTTNRPRTHKTASTHSSLPHTLSLLFPPTSRNSSRRTSRHDRHSLAAIRARKHRSSFTSPTVVHHTMANLRCSINNRATSPCPSCRPSSTNLTSSARKDTPRTQASPRTRNGLLASHAQSSTALAIGRASRGVAFVRRV